MGSRSIASRVANRRQRQKMHMSKYSGSKLMIRPENMGVENDIEIKPPTRDEVACTACGFKARYQFVRCPICGESRT